MKISRSSSWEIDATFTSAVASDFESEGESVTVVAEGDFMSVVDAIVVKIVVKIVEGIVAVVSDVICGVVVVSSGISGTAVTVTCTSYASLVLDSDEYSA